MKTQQAAGVLLVEGNPFNARLLDAGGSKPSTNP
jgi:hypothetical protein